jgi:hypothetical protein
MEDHRAKLASLNSGLTKLKVSVALIESAKEITSRVVCILDWFESQGLTEGPFSVRLERAFGVTPAKALELEKLLVRVAAGSVVKDPSGPAADPFAGIIPEVMQ